MAYSVFDPKVNRPLHELPREEAKAAYDWFIESIPERLEELRGVLREDGVDLDFSETSLSKLHEWFFEIAQEERLLGNNSPSPELFSVCNDVGIYIAEFLKKERGGVSWNFYVYNSKGVSYQRPVLTGFNVENKDYHIDLDYLICQYAFRVIKSGKKENDLFLSMFKKARSML